ncbi:MAG: MoxR family ATPase [Lachnospiraceae bacterium]|nr:MoxR family ATPase [Lachnospiraceae bacterium]
MLDLSRFTEYKKNVLDNCSQVIVGKENVITLVLTCFICSGHVLLKDVPGTGKTMLLRAFAKTVGGDFKRIQFTPDLLPSDLTGIHFYNQKTGSFEFRPGPILSNIVLADEINRATPRTQPSLLEAMEERQVTVDGVTMPLQEPFMVMATQNPLESYGTFPLPEAQIDRFFMRLSLGYMTREQELSVLSRPAAVNLLAGLSQTVTAGETVYVRTAYREVKVSDEVKDYLMDIIEGTREESAFVSGVSTRGALALYQASQAYAALSGRTYVLPEDVKYLAPFVLSHRLGAGDKSGAKSGDFLNRILERIRVPLEELP